MRPILHKDRDLRFVLYFVNPFYFWKYELSWKYLYFCITSGLRNSHKNDPDILFYIISFLGAFLLVYFIAMIFCGIPIFFQEVAIGQYLGSGGMTLVAQLCPMLKGKIDLPTWRFILTT